MTGADPVSLSADAIGARSAGARFEAMIRELSGDLYRFAYWLCGDETLAKDLVQETCLRAWRGFARLRDGEAVKPWLFTILRREHARLYERKRLALVDVDDHEIADAADWADPERSGTNQEIREAMLQLPAKYREPLLMQVLGGFTCAEIAAALNQQPGAVMTQLFRARQQLKSLLGANAAGASHELR